MQNYPLTLIWGVTRNYFLSTISLHFRQRCDEKKDNCHQRGIAQSNNILSELPTLWEIYGTREKWYLQGDLPVLEDDVDFLQSWTLKRVLSVLLHVQIDFNKYNQTVNEPGTSNLLYHPILPTSLLWIILEKLCVSLVIISSNFSHRNT